MGSGRDRYGGISVFIILLCRNSVVFWVCFYYYLAASSRLGRARVWVAVVTWAVVTATDVADLQRSTWAGTAASDTGAGGVRAAGTGGWPLGGMGKLSSWSLAMRMRSTACSAHRYILRCGARAAFFVRGLREALQRAALREGMAENWPGSAGKELVERT